MKKVELDVFDLSYISYYYIVTDDTTNEMEQEWNEQECKNRIGKDFAQYEA